MEGEENKRELYDPIEDDQEYACKKCKDTGKVLGKNGIHVCYDCLQAGRLDVHSKQVKDSKIKW